MVWVNGQWSMENEYSCAGGRETAMVSYVSGPGNRASVNRQWFPKLRASRVVKRETANVKWFPMFLVSRGRESPTSSGQAVNRQSAMVSDVQASLYVKRETANGNWQLAIGS